MKKIKRYLFCASSVLLLTACSEKQTAFNKQIDAHIQETSQTKEETQPKEEDQTGVSESKSVDNDKNAAYEEYINSLQYIAEIEAKLSMANTTLDMSQASGEALAAWDNELNKIYALLGDKLPAEQMEELRTLQRSWIKERDQLAEKSAAVYEGGTLEAVEYSATLVQCTKQRTLELVSIYFTDSSDFSYDLSTIGHSDEEKQSDTTAKSITFNTNDINQKYYGEDGSYVELDLKLPILEGTYDGIPAINTFFAGKEQFYYDQLPLEMLEESNHSGVLEGQADGYFVSAWYYLETQIGDIVSIPAVLDGGAGGVSWAAMEANNFTLNTGERISLSDLFRVNEDVYMDFIYDYISKEITKELQNGNGLFFFEDAYSEEGTERIKNYNRDNFIISDDGLIIFYQKYELAAGAAGVISFEIPYGSMKDILAIDTDH